MAGLVFPKLRQYRAASFRNEKAMHVVRPPADKPE